MSTISQQDVQKVLDELSDKRWDFRTIPGLVKATGLPEEAVREVIRLNRSSVYQSPMRDKQGRDLYTIRQNPAKLKDLLNFAQILITKSA